MDLTTQVFDTLVSAQEQSHFICVNQVCVMKKQPVPLGMCAGTETALARLPDVFAAARLHHAYLFANLRASRLKVLVHDGIGVCWPPGA